MRTVDSWFTFENRCFLCGEKLQKPADPRGLNNHLQSHVREGYLDDGLEQIKDHPIGFPGPPLGQQPSCSSHT